MSIFEVIMLVCFGAAWPLAIAKSVKTRRNGGKSLLFLIVILVGYVMGMLHKIYYQYDLVLALYIVNALMVSVEILLYFRNIRLQRGGEHPLRRLFHQHHHGSRRAHI